MNEKIETATREWSDFWVESVENGYVVTMNRAHSSHWTEVVDGIDHVLRGWSDQFGVAADHYLTLDDALIRARDPDFVRIGFQKFLQERSGRKPRKVNNPKAAMQAMFGHRVVKGKKGK